MAKKKEAKINIVLERVYNVPLRKEYSKAPRWNRTKKAVKALKEFLAKHMKSDDIKIGKYLNEELWKHGIKNPPHHVKVEAKKDNEGKVFAELAGAPKEEPKLKETEKKKKAKKEEKPETKEERLEEAVEEAKEEKQEIAKEIEKEEIKEMRKEHPKGQHAPKEILKQKPVQQHQTGPAKG